MLLAPVRNFSTAMWQTCSTDALRLILTASGPARDAFASFLACEYNENHLDFYLKVEQWKGARAEEDASGMWQQAQEVGGHDETACRATRMGGVHTPTAQCIVACGTS
jgi:hypothetical protein